MWNFLIEAQPREPAPRQMHAQFFDKLALAANAIQIADQHNAQQQLRIDRWTSGIAVAVLQLLTNEAEVDVHIAQPQQVLIWNLIFETEVVKQRFRAGVVTHHEPWSSANGNPQQHGRTMLLCRSHRRGNRIKIADLYRVFQHLPRLSTVEIRTFPLTFYPYQV